MTETPTAAATSKYPKRSIYAWIICLLILAAFGFRFPALFDPLMGADEGTTANFVFENDLAYIVTQFSLTGSSTNTHVFYSVMVNLANGLWGPIPFSVRLPAFFMGILGFPALFVLGRRLLDERVGLLAALLLVFSQRHWYYSIHGRGYSTIILTALLAFYFFWRGWQHNRRYDWFSFAFATVFGGYTHLSGILPLSAQGTFAVADTIRARRWRPFVSFVISAAASAIILTFLYLPMIAAMIGDARSQPYIPPFVRTPASILGLLAHIGPSVQRDVVAQVFLALFLFGVGATLRRRRAIVILLLLWMILPLVIAFTVRSYMFERFLLSLTGAYLLLVAYGLLSTADLLGRLGQRLWAGATRPAVSLLLSAVVVISLSFNGLVGWLTPRGPAWNEARAFLVQHIEAGDVLIVAPSLEGYAFIKEGVASRRRIGMGGRITTDRFCRYYSQPRRTWWILWPSAGEWAEEGFRVYPFRQLVILTREEPIATPEEAVAQTIGLLETLQQQWSTIELRKRSKVMQRLFYSLGNLYLGQGKVATATRMLDWATAKRVGVSSADRASAALALGGAYLMQGQMNAAEGAFQQARELGATDEEVAQAQGLTVEPGNVAGICPDTVSAQP